MELLNLRCPSSIVGLRSLVPRPKGGGPTTCRVRRYHPLGISNAVETSTMRAIRTSSVEEALDPRSWSFLSRIERRISTGPEDRERTHRPKLAVNLFGDTGHNDGGDNDVSHLKATVNISEAGLPLTGVSSRRTERNACIESMGSAPKQKLHRRSEAYVHMTGPNRRRK